VDYNRQSLDAVVSDRLFGRIDALFEMFGWRVVTLKYGRLLQAAFARADGEQLREWIDACPNSLYSALVYKGGEGWREHLRRDLNRYPGIRAILDEHDDAALGALMTNLAGHDMGSVLEAFHGVTDDQPTCRCRSGGNCRPRRPLAASSAGSPPATARSLPASSRPRPTSRCRPISAPGSIAAASSIAPSAPTPFAMKKSSRRSAGRWARRASTSSSASPSTISSCSSPRSVSRGRCSGSASYRSARSTTRSSSGGSTPSTTRSTRMRASSWWRPR